MPSPIRKRQQELSEALSRNGWARKDRSALLGVPDGTIARWDAGRNVRSNDSSAPEKLLTDYSTPEEAKAALTKGKRESKKKPESVPEPPVPKATHKLSPEEKEWIWTEHQSGVPNLQLASDLGVDERTVRRVVAVAREEAAAEEKRTAAREANAPKDGSRYRLLEGEFLDVAAKIPPGTVDVILTDPPYDEKSVAKYGELSRFAASVLRPGGSLFAMIGQMHLPRALQELSDSLVYQWTLAYLTPGGKSPTAPLKARRVNSFWKPVVWLVNGDYDGKVLGDVAKSAENDNDKRWHQWGQSESGMGDLIERTTEPGEVVLDPYLGGGTTGVAAVVTGRYFIGIEANPETLAVASARLAEAAS